MFRIHIKKNSFHYNFIIKEYYINHIYLQEKKKVIK